jgi:hypothetical protein
MMAGPHAGCPTTSSPLWWTSSEQPRTCWPGWTGGCYISVSGVEIDASEHPSFVRLRVAYFPQRNFICVCLIVYIWFSFIVKLLRKASTILCRDVSFLYLTDCSALSYPLMSDPCIMYCLPSCQIPICQCDRVLLTEEQYCSTVPGVNHHSTAGELSRGG